MYPDECTTCGADAFILTCGLCRRCRLAEMNGGYVFPELLTGNDKAWRHVANAVCNDLQAMLAKHAAFKERYGE